MVVKKMMICNTEQEYIDAIAEPVQRVCKRYGYLPSVLIGQSCLENGYGIPEYWDNPQIETLLKYNNMVGIKSELLNSSWNKYTVWTGESLTKQTPEFYNGKHVTITDSFRKYDTIERSFADFLLFITYASNYGEGGTPKYGSAVTTIKDPETLIKKVNALGYATSTTYASNVLKIIKKHDLTKYVDLSNVTPTIYVPDNSSEASNVILSQRTYLQKGDKGNSVKIMQTMLIACGYSCGSYGADGDFGDSTLNALKSFQRENNLVVDGLYGEQSERKLTDLYNEQAVEESIFNGIDYSPVYDYTYYKNKYKDLQDAFGSNKGAYFKHFCTYGMKEGRQASSSFNVQNYKSRYSDLEKAFGDNLLLYYEQYLKFGISEKRNAQ